MQLKNTYKEAIYLLPVITSNAICFLFWILEYKEKSKWIAWFTPYLTYSWLNGRKELWIGWLNWGIAINFKRYKIIIEYVVYDWSKDELNSFFVRLNPFK